MDSTRARARRSALGVALLVATIALSGTLVAGAAAHGDGDETLGKLLVEINVPTKATIDELLARDVDLAEYVRQEEDGTLTVNAIVDDEELEELRAAGYAIGRTIENDETYAARIAERAAALAAEERSHQAAETGKAPEGSRQAAGLRSMAFLSAAANENTVNRVDYFQNYAGWFLSVEVYNRATAVTGTTTVTGPTVSFAWRTAGGDYGSATTIPRFIDTDPTPDAYLYHRILVRIGAAGTNPDPPVSIRVASSTPGVAPVEAPVKAWLNNPLPAGEVNFAQQYFTAYMDPTQVRDRFRALASEFGGPGGIAQLIPLPHLTDGYRRKAAAIMNGTGGIGTAPSTAAQSQTVVLWSHAFGHEGGNNVRAQFRNPGVAGSPLAVSVLPNASGQADIVVDLGTSSTGALASTAAQVRDAINAHPAASALVSATTWAGTNAGAGIVQPRALVNLSDFLNGPAHVDRGPFQVEVLRISKDAGKAPADSNKVGVYLFCQQHAREWVTPITCLQTAELLLRNYATDPRTRELVDNLDIFVLPSVNPDGSHYSLYDFTSQRRTMRNYCNPNSTSSMPSGRNTWGVDLNRNSESYSLFDGYFGASTSCTSDTFAGPSEASEPETKNLNWIVDTFPNIKFANNIHTYGGYFMWAPGSYIGAGRITAPAPNHGVEAYFFAAADTVLQRIKDVRGTVVLPGRTGPIADVLYSAAGNAADDFWYRKGIIGYSFEAGSDRFSSTTTGTGQSAVGFQPNFANEGRFEALEFAAGNFGLLESALAYARDETPPVVEMSGLRASQNPIDTTFKWVNEPSTVYYTLDGSEPGVSSPKWERERLRGPGEQLTFTQSTTVRWLAVDIAGNSSAGNARFSVDTTPPTIALRLPVDGGQYPLGSTPAVDFSCADDDAGVKTCAGTQPDGAALDTSSVGLKTFAVNAEDEAGNTASTTATYNVHWPFTGFAPPFGRRNETQAGSAFPIKWSLGGNRGLGVLAGATSERIDCATGDPVAGTEEAADLTSLSYDATTRLYQVDWKTKRGYAGTCRELSMKLADNTTKTATFLFRS